MEDSGYSKTAVQCREKIKKVEKILQESER